ncbi:tetratricopeptide repeat protein [Thermocrinis sp.]
MLLIVLALHFIASLILASALAGFLRFYKYNYAKSFLLGLNIFFFLGPLAVLLGSLFLLIYPKISKIQTPVKDIDHDIIYSLEIPAEKRMLDEGAIRFLKSKSIERVIYFTKFTNALTVDFFKKLLYSDQDELRLLANSYLKNLENSIQDYIKELISYIQNYKDLGDQQRFFVEKNLCMLYWELYYLGLVEREIGLKYLYKAKEYGEQALKVARSPILLFIMGKIELAIKDYKKAYEYFIESIEKGMGKGEVLPYLIEALYKAKDFETLREVLRRNEGTYTLNPKALNLLKAWV